MKKLDIRGRNIKIVGYNPYIDGLKNREMCVG